MTSPCNRFFKIILRKSLEHGNLKLPGKFTRKHGDVLPKTMFLKPPDGTEWKIHWTKNDAEICFEKDWKEFAAHYSIDHGHLVVFEYDRTSHFEVHIFDMTGLEIEYPCHDQISEDSSKKKRMESPMSSPQPHKKLRSGKTKDVESSPNSQNLFQHVETKGTQSEGTDSQVQVIASIKQELDDEKSTQRARQLSPRHGTTGNMKRAKKFTSRNPFFIINIRQGYLAKVKPRISTVFAREYFNEKRDVMIQYRKKIWPAKVLYYPSLCKASI